MKIVQEDLQVCEMVLGQDFDICRCAEEWEKDRKYQVQNTDSRIAQSFKVKRNWFERLFIVMQKLWAGIRPLKFPDSFSAVGFSSNRWTWETNELPKLNKGIPGHWSVRDESQEGRHVLLWCDLTKQSHKGDQMRISKSSFSPDELKSKILRGYCGGQLIPQVLLESIQGWPAKEEMKTIL